jgi:hypothetical protein
MALSFGPGWLSRFKMKDLLSGDDASPERVHEIGLEVGRRMRSMGAFSFRRRDALVAQFEAAVDQDGFNAALSAMYDAGDEERVWIE